MDFTAEKIKGADLWHLGKGRFIGVDRGSADCWVECEVQRHADGSITVLDIREYPATKPKS